MPDERPISEKKYGINKHRFLGVEASLSTVSRLEKRTG